MSDKVIQTVLCYGDSNVWGYRPGDGMRFDEDTRWPRVLGTCLGPGYRIVEEGLNGRSLGSFAPPGDPANGKEYLVSVHQTGGPYNVIILYLGINDLLRDNELSAAELGRELEQLIAEIYRIDASFEEKFREKGFSKPEIIVLSPVPAESKYTYEFPFQGLRDRISRTTEAMKKTCGKTGAVFVDTSHIIEASYIDGVHLDARNHVLLGNYLCDFLRNERFSGG
ncbi:MAG: GDSL-type esterase/lipase family protein [Spirochaetia bacterium]